jgi:hypothetical protein
LLLPSLPVVFRILPIYIRHSSPCIHCFTPASSSCSWYHILVTTFCGCCYAT